jgi:nucleotide-binding universal stress UspA family protein
VSASWREIAGNDVDVVLALGRLRDLVVIADAPVTSRLVPAGAGTLLLGGRPVLLAGSGTPRTIGRHIAIAWKDTPEAARAVWAAMPLLAGAEKVTVLSVEEGIQGDQGGQAALLEQLRWRRIHGEGATVSADGRPAPEALLGAAAKAKADLLVMGAYGHGSLREMIFGGFTRHMLKGRPLPVLMVH